LLSTPIIITSDSYLNRFASHHLIIITNSSS
jgi:hypothetical protein